MQYWENRNALKADSNVPAYILTIIKTNASTTCNIYKSGKMPAKHLKNHAEWELNTRISTLEACDPEELFTAEAQEIVNKTAGPELALELEEKGYDWIKKEMGDE